MIPAQTLQKLNDYLDRLKVGYVPGEYLQRELKKCNLNQISIAEFLELLVRTKRPQIFAEMAVYGNGRDWNQAELSILGDISIVTPVMVYDNGRHRSPQVHPTPFSATLIFTPGALLRNGQNLTPADWEEVVREGEIDPTAYARLDDRRLLPGFNYIQQTVCVDRQQAFITIPGLGCGQFAGKFRGTLGEQLKHTLVRFLETHGHNFPNIKAVYYDPYSECDNQRIEINHISLMVRPLTKGNISKPQLCQPEHYAEIENELITYYLLLITYYLINMLRHLIIQIGVKWY